MNQLRLVLLTRVSGYSVGSARLQGHFVQEESTYRLLSWRAHASEVFCGLHAAKQAGLGLVDALSLGF